MRVIVANIEGGLIGYFKDQATATISTLNLYHILINSKPDGYPPSGIDSNKILPTLPASVLSSMPDEPKFKKMTIGEYFEQLKAETSMRLPAAILPAVKGKKLFSRRNTLSEVLVYIHAAYYDGQKWHLLEIPRKLQ
jgi:hypothetical protein